MNAVRGLLFPGVVVFVTTLIGVWLSAESRAQTPTQAPAAAPAVAGQWTLNKDLSDVPGADDRDQRQDDSRRGGQRRGGMGGSGRGGMRGGYGGGGGARTDTEDAQRMRQAMRDELTPPERLTIVQTETKMIVLTTGDGRVTRLSPDGKKIKDENTKIERKTKWDADKLVSEVNGLGRGKITETYTVDPDHKELIVTLTTENQRSGQPSTQKRVYTADAK